MNFNIERASIPLPEQEPGAGSLRMVERRLEGALAINTGIMNDATVSEQKKDMAHKVFCRVSWQQITLERLKNWKIHEAVDGGATWSDAEEQASKLSANEALLHLEDWMQQNFDGPPHAEDPDSIACREYAEDLRSKLIDEASRS
ncbi:MAG TPA: hypothetical protein VF733_04395 [Candidatus Saccharimonadales bacterium]